MGRQGSKDFGRGYAREGIAQATKLCSRSGKESTKHDVLVRGTRIEFHGGIAPRKWPSCRHDLWWHHGRRYPDQRGHAVVWRAEEPHQSRRAELLVGNPPALAGPAAGQGTKVNGNGAPRNPATAKPLPDH